MWDCACFCGRSSVGLTCNERLRQSCNTCRKNTNKKKKMSMIRWLMADKQNENLQLMQKHDNYTSSWGGAWLTCCKCWAKHTWLRDKQKKRCMFKTKPNGFWKSSSGQYQNINRIKQKIDFMEFCSMYRGKLPVCPYWCILLQTITLILFFFFF